MRSSSDRAAAEFDLNIALRVQELMRFAIYESCGVDDVLFVKGWLENPLVVCKAVPTGAGVVPPTISPRGPKIDPGLGW